MREGVENGISCIECVEAYKTWCQCKWNQTLQMRQSTAGQANDALKTLHHGQDCRCAAGIKERFLRCCQHNTPTALSKPPAEARFTARTIPRILAIERYIPCVSS